MLGVIYKCVIYYFHDMRRSYSRVYNLSLQHYVDQPNSDLIPKYILLQLQHNMQLIVCSDVRQRNFNLVVNVNPPAVSRTSSFTRPVICCQILFGSKSNFAEPVPTFSNCSS